MNPWFLKLAPPCSVGSSFLNFPWDQLLLESSLLCLLLPPPARWHECKLSHMPPLLVRIAIIHLNARLMLGMGMQKFYDNDPDDRKADGGIWNEVRIKAAEVQVEHTHIRLHPRC